MEGRNLLRQKAALAVALLGGHTKPYRRSSGHDRASVRRRLENRTCGATGGVGGNVGPYPPPASEVALRAVW